MKDIKEFSREELAKWCEENGIKPFRAVQIFRWLYLHQADDFDEMTDIGKDMREILKKNFSISRLVLENSEMSVDGTEKLLFRLSDNRHVEAVIIPGKKRFTLCISSQVGCAQACRFCLTAKGGFQRNLTSAEIVSQVRDAGKILGKRVGDKTATLSNIVFMGMGEPLANYDAVVKSLSIITDSDYGLKFSPRRVTISTCGLVPEIKRLNMDTFTNLAISLNATDDKTRSMIMPINKKYPIKELLEACRTFKTKPRNRITFEYILIKDLNDTDRDAQRLVKMLAPIKAKINLIPFNEHEKSNFKRPSPSAISHFLQILLDSNMTAIIRKSKGDDISAACGQLKGKFS
ncbi:MAG: 23S rRNA (adenine(2503)-C(2))-methyltransferase RlmN [Thermodesulfobacteriota bacterium]|nr:23S rRNA (adenine(2503)-C(2))-methyltransferase RlmN [Thermodesulfobacteriota bacterium]